MLKKLKTEHYVIGAVVLVGAYLAYKHFSTKMPMTPPITTGGAKTNFIGATVSPKTNTLYADGTSVEKAKSMLQADGKEKH